MFLWMQNLRFSKVESLAQGEGADKEQDLNPGQFSHKAVTVSCHLLISQPWPCLRKHVASSYSENEWNKMCLDSW